MPRALYIARGFGLEADGNRWRIRPALRGADLSRGARVGARVRALWMVARTAASITAAAPIRSRGAASDKRLRRNPQVIVDDGALGGPDRRRRAYTKVMRSDSIFRLTILADFLQLRNIHAEAPDRADRSADAEG